MSQKIGVTRTCKRLSGNPIVLTQTLEEWLSDKRLGGAAHQPGLATVGGIRMNNSPLGCLVNNAGENAQRRGDFLRIARDDSRIGLLHERLDATPGRLIAELTLA